MRTSERIASIVAGQIYSVYARPLMHANHSGVDHLLFGYHWVWAIANEAEFKLSELTKEMYLRENATDGTGGLWASYKIDKPDCGDDEALEYVVSQWRAVSNAIGIPATSPDHPLSTEA